MITPAPQHSTTLVLRRTFAAERARVFRAWITPAALEAWFRPGGKSMTVQSLDARVGGSFRFELEDGSSIIGTYRQMVPPEKLVFSWYGDVAQSWETVVTVDFLDRGAVTEVVLTHEHPGTLVRAEAVWAALFDALASVLSSPQLDL